ncbi:MAG: hypothetical protein OEX19_05205 [Gammaproteobacteria bacterium]|nr:hypothetical protein [Gammaproteobacteria bacterium]
MGKTGGEGTPDKTLQNANDSQVIDAAELSDNAEFRVLAKDLDKKPVSFDVRENTAYMTGVIDSSIPVLLRNLLENHPQVDTIVMQQVNGSIDLAATYEAGRILREACLTTVVPYDGFIASGGVSLFLAGCERIIENKSKVGIHTWRSFTLDDQENKVVTISGIELDESDEQHKKHQTYITDMDIPEEFYWRTVNTPFDEVHYLTNDELMEYSIITVTQQEWGANYNAQIDRDTALGWQQTRFYTYNGIVTQYGKIGPDAAENLTRLLDENSEVNTIEFGVVQGISDIHQDYAKDLGHVIRTACLTSRLTETSEIFGEAIHSFIAGCNREVDEKAIINIASSYNPEIGRSNTDPYFYQKFVSAYLNYYNDMGIDPAFFSYQMSVPMYQPKAIAFDDLSKFGIL